MNDIKRVAVYAASSSLAGDDYMKAAEELGALLASRGMEIVYGAGKLGLMGALADSALSHGGAVTGVIPKFMVDNGWCHDGLTRLIVTKDMHERKERIVSLAQATIALPGGVGTMEELLEIITWKQLGLYACPVVILNVDGYFNPLLEMFSNAIDNHFMRDVHRKLWRVASDAREAVKLVEETEPWDTSISKMAQI